MATAPHHRLTRGGGEARTPPGWVAGPITSTSKIYASHKAFEIIPIRKGVTDPNDQNYSPRIRKKTCCITCSLRVRDTDVLSTRWLEYKRHWRPLQRARKVSRATPFASPDDGVTVNGVPQTSSSSELEQMRVKLDRALQNEDLSSGLIQSIHDAARAIELAILEHSSSLKDTWFRKTWLGVDKNAWVKTLSYQAAVDCLLKAVIEVSSRGDGRDRDINIFVKRSLVRLCGPLESITQEQLSRKQPAAYEWFWSHQHPMVVTTFVNLFEKDPCFSAATSICCKGESTSSSTASDLSLLMLALSCLAAVTKLGSAKVSCPQFFSMVPDVTGRFMDMLLDFVPISEAYKSMKAIGLQREFLFHFGPRAAIGKFLHDHGVEEISFWVDLVQKQLQRAIDREKIWSRLTTCESIEVRISSTFIYKMLKLMKQDDYFAKFPLWLELAKCLSVLEKDLAIFGFFIALGRSTQSYLSSNGLTAIDDPIQDIISYLIGGSVLYYPQLSSISSYQLYVEVVCEELEWLPFYQSTSSIASSDGNVKGEGTSTEEVISRVLCVCSYWMTSFIKYSTWLENPSHIKAARYLSKGHSMLNDCMTELGIAKNRRKDTKEYFDSIEQPRASLPVDLDLDSFDKALESVEEALVRLENLLQELHLSSSNSGKEHLKAACSDLEKIRKLKKEAEFLEASFRAKAASLEQVDTDDSPLSSGSEQGRIKNGKTSNEAATSTNPMERCCSSEVLSYSFPKIIWADQNRNKKNPLQAAIAKMNNQDSESNDIRRFEALRNELIELEKRVQRSTDDAENEEETDPVDDRDKHAPAAKPLMLLPTSKKDNMIAKSMEKLKETTTDVWQGTQLLAIDVAAASVLLKRSLTGDELTDKEKKALQRTVTDLASVVPIGILMLLPVTAVGHAAILAFIQRYVPTLIPSTYAPERLNLLRQLEKVKEMETTESNPDEAAEAVSLTSSSK
ncbi:LETM1 and EF-hand domain-containing protein anon-60Da, mitochondrial [Ananas comosus]|uniref:LETM1 and EF-hand domain-containing protein anon-60Da, mitochondrial n=1 Tax=Ananas comosus TaxID=4615 RepID=A0A199VMH6_ANACO|nr:LETM1 and EF-hand domain-containing protein anon-60Da, mitochondrial [Ananas comosus]